MKKLKNICLIGLIFFSIGLGAKSINKSGLRPMIYTKATPFYDPITVAKPKTMDVSSIVTSFQNATSNIETEVQKELKNAFVEKIGDMKESILADKNAKKFFDNGEDFMNALNKVYEKYAKMVKSNSMVDGQEFLMGASYSQRGFNVTMILRDVGIDEKMEKGYFGFMGTISFSGNVYAVIAPRVELNEEGKIDDIFQMSFLGNYQIPLTSKHKLTIEGIPQVPRKVGKKGETVSVAEKIDKKFSYLNFSFTKIIEGMSLVGKLDLDENFIPLDVNKLENEGSFEPLQTHVSVPVTLEAPDFQNILFDIELPPFKMKGLDDFAFKVERLVIDMSDKSNSEGIKFPEDYNHPFKGKNLWRGFYLKNAALYLPPTLSTDGKITTIRTTGLLVDDSGVTGNFLAQNLVSLEKGKWGSNFSFALDEVKISLSQNILTYGGIKGRLRTSINEKDPPFKFEGEMGYNEQGSLDYQFTVGGLQKMNIDFFVGEATLSERTEFSLNYIDGEIEPEVNLYGKFSFNKESVGLEDIYFEGLRVSSRSMSIERLRSSASGSLGGMDLEVSTIDLQVKNNRANLIIDAKVSIGESFSGGTVINIISLKKESWGFERVEVRGIQLAGSFGMVSFSGTIKYLKGDPVYGDVFAGEVTLEVKDHFSLQVAAAFGKKDGMNYFFMDALANFGKSSPMKIPPLAVTGIGGAMGYHVNTRGSNSNSLVETPSGTIYTPDKKKGLYLRFSLDYALDGSDAVMNGKAVFEISFNPNWGVDKMGIFGKVSVMKAPELASMEQMKAKTQEMNLANQGDKKMKSFELSEETKNFYPFKVDPNQDGFHGMIGINIDVTNGAFDARADIFIRAGSMVKGKGFLHYHHSSKGWFLKVGEPSNRNFLDVSIPALGSQRIESYFMVGTMVPEIPDPPSEVLNILQSAKVAYKPTAMTGGGNPLSSGIVFGLTYRSSGSLDIGIFYADFKVGLGFDVALRNYEGFSCKGSSGEIGFNGWYGQGQAYAWLKIDLGVRIDTFFYSGSFTILESETALLMQMSGPNPWWFRGTLAGRYNICGGAISGRYALTVEFGEKCELEMTKSPLERLDIISDMSPQLNQKGVDVFSTPMLVLNMEANKEHVIKIPKKADISYKLELEEFYVEDNTGKRLAGKIAWNSTQEIANLSTESILPGEQTLKMKATLVVWTKKNGNWVKFKNKEGKEVRETKEHSFTTGPEPPFIRPSNMKFTYPLPEMKYFYPKEHNQGYIQLIQKRENLLTNIQGAKALFVDENQKVLKAQFSYDVGKNRITYTLPEGFVPNADYNFALVKSRKGSGKSAETKENEKVTTYDENNETRLRQREILGNAISEDDQVLVSYPLHVSKFKTFGEKMGDANQLSGTERIGIGGTGQGMLNNIQLTEKLSNQEMVGSRYSEEKPLIHYTVNFENSNLNEIKSAFYNLELVQSGLKSYTNTPVGKRVGVPPIRSSAIVYSKYLGKTFPYYNTTQYHIGRQIQSVGLDIYLNKYDRPYTPQEQEFLDRDIQAVVNRISHYDVNYTYILPNGEKGTSHKIQYRYE
ncbi:MAG: hypothetical protein OIF50_07220 [Flavobacteriaceae bacterium]|nr:hypothetical protein [Flavobacteriaceae bacterium]